MIPASRIKKVDEYYFSKKLNELRELHNKGELIINLGIGNPDLKVHPLVLKELIHASNLMGSNAYQSYRGIPELREAFSNWYSKMFHVNLNPQNEILPLMGSKEGIMHIHLAFCNKGDTVLIPNPGYPAYSAVAKLLELNIVYYNLTSDNKWLPDLNELENLVDDNCKIIWINYPHMPTGVNANSEFLKNIVLFSKKRNVLLINDNPYSLILNDHRKSLLSFSHLYDNIIELNSLSKSHNMAGWRIGMVAASEHNINCILKVKSNFDSGMFKPIQQAAIKALELSEEWYVKLNIENSLRREIMWNILDVLDCTYNRKSSGLFIWAEIPSNYNNSEDFSDYLLYEKKIFATPGTVFGDNGKKYIRFSLCSHLEVLKEVLNRLKK